jgi:hypothetical protein
LALFPVNDTERAEQFVKLFADELRLRARMETLVVVGNRLWRTVYLSKLPGLDKKIRVAFDWTSDLLFPKDVCAVYDLEHDGRNFRWAGQGKNAARNRNDYQSATLALD